jgi:hypothetical protein
MTSCDLGFALRSHARSYEPPHSVAMAHRTTRRHLVKKKATAVILGVVLALTLSGCMRMHTSMTFNSDDTVDGSMIIAIQDSVAETAGMTPDEMWESASAEMDTSVPDGATSEPYAEDGFTGEKYTFASAPLSELDDETLSVTHEGDEFIVDGELDLTATDDMAGMETYMESIDIKFTMTFPGKVTEASGEIDGNTVTWIGTFGEVLELTARASAIDNGEGGGDGSDGSDGQGWILWAGIGAGVVIIGALGAWLIISNKKTGAPATAATSQAWGQPGQQPAQPGQPTQWGQLGQGSPVPPTQPYGQQPPAAQPWGQPQPPVQGQPGQTPPPAPGQPTGYVPPAEPGQTPPSA